MIGLISRLAAFVQNAPPPPPAISIRIECSPEIPDEEEEIINDPLSPEALGEAEGQTFMIEYRDTSGHVTRRRISVWDIQESTNGRPCLIARCHERKAQRTFRVDRIQCCIDLDGEVFEDVPRFLHETFGMALHVARGDHPTSPTRTAIPAAPIQQKSPDKSEKQHFAAYRSKIRHQCALFSAMTLVDGDRNPAQFDISAKYCADFLKQAGTPLPSDHDRDLLKYLRGQRPSERQIARAIEEIRSFDPKDLIAVLQTCADLMDADGTRAPEEVDLLNELSVELIGVPIID